MSYFGDQVIRDFELGGVLEYSPGDVVEYNDPSKPLKRRQFSLKRPRVYGDLDWVIYDEPSSGTVEIEVTTTPTKEKENIMDVRFIKAKNGWTAHIGAHTSYPTQNLLVAKTLPQLLTLVEKELIDRTTEEDE